MKKYKNALQELQDHSYKQYHIKSLERAGEFIGKFESGESVSVLIDHEHKNIIKQNRKRLVPIVKTIIFCGRNNLPLRSHREKGSLNDEKIQQEVLSGAQGVFRALLAFRIDSGDTNLLEHLKTTGKNATMISNTIQNDVIHSVGEEIQSIILERIKNAKFFSILVDETTDSSRKEQMTICIRYVDSKIEDNTFLIREDFLSFVEVKSMTGVALKESLENQLTKMNLDLSDCRGQGYDGGSNMAGKENGKDQLPT